MDIIGRSHKGGGKAKKQKKQKKMASHFSEGADFFFCFFGLAACTIPPFYYESNLQPQRGVVDTVGRRHKGGGGGGQGQKKKKIGLPFFRGGRFFFFFLAWLPAPSLHSTTRTISSRNNFAELKPSEYEPIRHYLDTTILQVIHSIGYNSKIVVFMHPAKPGPQGDAFCILTYVLL